MKKIYLIMLTVFLNMALFSCSPTGNTDNSETANQESCCGEDGDLPPPPPNGAD